MMDAPDPRPFIMHNARGAMAAGLSHAKNQIEAIEQAIIENPSLTFDLAKTLVESTCCTVLKERSIPYTEKDDLPKLFQTVSQNLPFLPPSESEAVGARRSLERTLNGLSTVIHGICELRNQCGFASHGSGGPRPTMEVTQALLAAGAADTIVGFLHSTHRQNRKPSSGETLLFDKNVAFNEYLDRECGLIRICEVEFRPSEVLFSLERETYRIYLAEFDEDCQDSTGLDVESSK